MPMPRVLILHNEPTLPADHPDADSEHDILYTADCVSKALQEAGLAVSRFGLTDDPTAALAGLKAAAPDAVFNLYEGTAKWGHTEAFVAGLMEMLRVPFTGSPTKPLLLCRSKPLTKQLLAGAGLPTAGFMVVERLPVPPCPLPWPVIVKPGLEDASVGIEQKSVVSSQVELEERIEYVLRTYGPPVLVEQFVRGREFNVAVLERNGRPETLPFSEILFVPPADAPDLWHIVSFDAKWRPGTRDFVATPAVNPANVTPEMFAEVSGLAIRAFELVGCRDYARVDFRVDESGRPFVLEVNPNPCISPLAGLAAALETAKIPYPEFILGLVKAALRRGPTPELADRLSGSTPTDLPVNGHTNEQTPVAVRAARPTDLPAIADLLARLDAIPKDDRDRAKRRIAAGIEREAGGSTCLLAVSDGKPVGVCGLRTEEDGHGVRVVELLAVSPTERRRGIGRALLAAIESSAAAAGGRTLMADLSSAPWYGPARQFLARLGFKPAGEVPDYHRDGYSRLTYAKPIQAQTTVADTPTAAVETARRSLAGSS